jgi:hypothetical protein
MSLWGRGQTERERREKAFLTFHQVISYKRVLNENIANGQVDDLQLIKYRNDKVFTQILDYTKVQGLWR